MRYCCFVADNQRTIYMTRITGHFLQQMMTLFSKTLKLMVVSTLFISWSWVQAEQPLVQTSCANETSVIEYWRNVRANAATANASELMPTLVNCLTSPNAELRDRIGYEVLTYWMRKESLSPEDVSELRNILVPWLSDGVGTSGNNSALTRAFSALVLSEVVRYDSLTPTMTSDEVDQLHSAALSMFTAERDYRGLTQEYGWIHTIAHGADLIWRLAMHKGLSTAAQQQAILNALTVQVARADLPAYTFNEFDRLARVAVAVISTELLTPKAIDDWVVKMGAPHELENWNNAFASPSGMAQLHNQKHFLRALNAALDSAITAEDSANKEVLNNANLAVITALSKLP